MRIRLLAALMALIALVPQTSLADQVSASDPNDTLGKLDMRSVAHGHFVNDAGAEFFVHTIRTYGEWRSRVLGRTETHFILWFDTDGDGEQDRGAGVGYQDGRLGASMSTYECDGDACGGSDLGDVKVRRLNKRSLRLWLPVEMMSDQALTHYDWWVENSYTANRGSDCRDPYDCSDRVPDEGALTHTL